LTLFLDNALPRARGLLRSERTMVVLNLFTFSVRGEPVEPHTCFLQVPHIK
jgi:hypothetical protein